MSKSKRVSVHDMQEKNNKACTINYFVPSIYKSCARLTILFPRFINLAQDLLICSLDL